MAAKRIGVDLVEQRLVFGADDERRYLEDPLWRRAAGPDDREHIGKGLTDLHIKSLILQAGSIRLYRELTRYKDKSGSAAALDIRPRR